MRQVTAQEKYRAVNEGTMAKPEFIRQMKLAFPQFLSPSNGYDDTVQILKNYNLINEIKVEQDDTSKYSDDSLRRAIDIELEAMGLMSQESISVEDQSKAKKKAIANLKKDPLHYYNLISGESSKVDKHDGYKETKRGKLEKDTFNDMKKATLKERKERLVEGTRALVGYLAGDTLTTTYNHYDGYPSNLGKGLEAHYNNDDAAKDIAMKGYITGMDADTGEISQTHQEAPGKLKLPADPEQRAREVAEEIDKFGADYGYVWNDESNEWLTIKNTGIRSMIDQIMDKMGVVAEADAIPTEPGIPGQRASNHDRKMVLRKIIDFLTKDGHPKSGYKVSTDDALSFIKTHKDDIFSGDIDYNDIEAVWDEYDHFETINRDSVDEKKGKDHDGDGDVDTDDYMAAKDKAIKKAMGKDVDELAVDRKGNPKIDSEPSRFKGRDKSKIRGLKEGRGDMDIIKGIIKDRAAESGFEEREEAAEVIAGIADEYMLSLKVIQAYMDSDGPVNPFDVNEKNETLKEAVKAIITKSLEEEMINEAATNELSRIADEYDSFDGLKPAVIALENIVTEIESFYMKTRDKIQKIYDDLGEVKNEEGLKVGAFITPSIENAFKKDLRPITKAQFHGGLKMPQVKRISQDDIDRGYVQQEAPKQTVYSPVNEKKK
tara:strand:- start:328 stop:2307 length:1980 start_codon:yes stop_codon:yes gene_type:complete